MADLSALEGAKIMERLGKDDDLWWAILLLVPGAGNAKPAVRLMAEGGTNLADMTRHLADDQIQFILFKVLGVDTRGSVVSTRQKFVFGQWVGPQVRFGRVLMARSLRARRGGCDRTPVATAHVCVLVATPWLVR